VLRRCSGGGTVLQGPGCLNYALFLRVNDSPALESITGTNSFVMQRHRTALSDLLGREVQQQGHTDLALDGRKFCGNAQRRRKNYVLFHGCFLLGLDIGAIEQALPLPSKRPEYRRDRTHRDFLVNLNLPPAALKEALRRAWGATEPLEEFPLVQTEALVRERYSLREWNRKF
jgi:lipoate-protein ligase A